MMIINDTEAINIDNFINSWDYSSEKWILFVLSALGLPANIFLIIYFTCKIKSYKRLNKNDCIRRLGYIYTANCYNTYFIEICICDTIISLYLLMDTLLQVLNENNLIIYSSLLDISHFTCKFFIYILRISSSMSCWLTFLLSFNRCMLLFRIRTNTLCINTKYLTLFLFCACTISNVFRLELFDLQSLSTTTTTAKTLTIEPLFITKTYECNVSGLKTANIYWPLFVYNLVFILIPAFGNLILSVYLSKRLSLLKKILYIGSNNSFRASTSDDCSSTTNGIITCIHDSHQHKKRSSIYFDEFHIEYLLTCMPCIYISCTNFIFYVPYTIIDLTNQFRVNFLLMKVLICLNYFRYLFHECKFYLLFFNSYKFRKDLLRFCRFK
jgi:hypothetical protein